MTTKTPCPRCEAEQAFPMRFEDEPRLTGVKRCFIRCTTCRWMAFIGFTTDDIETLRKNVVKAAVVAANEEKRHNRVSSATQQLLGELRYKRNRLVAELQARLQEHGIDPSGIRIN